MDYMCEVCGTEPVKQGESVAVQVHVRDEAGQPVSELPAYDIDILLRTERTTAMVFSIGETHRGVRAEVDEYGYVTFLLAGDLTATLQPGEYFMEMRLRRNGAAIEMRVQKLFTLIESDLCVLKPIGDLIKTQKSEVLLPRPRQISVSMNRVLDGFSPRIVGVKAADGTYRLSITTADGNFTTPVLNAAGTDFILSRADTSGGYDPQSERYHYRIAIGKFNTELLDPTKYRLCYMYTRRVRERRENTETNANAGIKWVVPMFGSILCGQNGVESIDQTYIPVTGSRIDISLLSKRILGARTLYTSKSGFTRFCLTQTTRWKTGVAIFRYEGTGSPGWYRCSNIFGVELAIGNRKVSNISKVNTSFIIE